MLQGMTLVLAQEKAAPTSSTPGNAQQGTGQTVAPGAPLPQQQRPADPFGPQFLILMVGAMAILWLFTANSQKKEKKQHEDMLANLKKGDTVQTIGGVLGTIVEVRDKHVVVKVDEANNTRLRFTREAIRSVVSEKEESKDSSKETKA